MRPKIALTLLAAASLALAACGGNDEGASNTTASAGSGDFPVTVSQALGEVTIEAPPERVVALDYPSADAALALGVMPVGMIDVTYVDGGIQTWTRRAMDRLGGEPPELIDTEGGFPFEKIQRLEPDVILATNTYPLIEESWEQLNAIAPVVGHVEGPGMDDWRQGVRQVAKALGREAEGDDLLDEVGAEIDQAKSEHPELAGKSVSIFNYVAGDGLYVINDDEDASIRFFRQLGFAGVPEQVAALQGQEGRAKISPERYPTIDADVIVGTSPEMAQLEELERDSLFRRVPAVESGDFLSIDIGEVTAMAFPSVLSVPYAIEELVDPIASAVSSSEG
jgi:iron complex transport system substrate-binding protein